MTRVLHVLPHRGGGGETYVDALAGISGAEHERVALSSGQSPLSAAMSLPRLWPAAAAAARRFDLVHAHGDVAAALAVPMLRARASTWSTHGLHFLRRARGPRLAAARRAVRAAIAGADRTICTSDAERAELAVIAGDRLAGRLVLVHNGLDAPPAPTADERAAARRALGLGDDRLVALYLGRLERRKDPLTAVRAAAAAGEPVTLLVAGDGPLREEVESSAGASVRVLGQRDDVPVLLAASDVLVMPSQREGLSYAVLEAMAAGLAPVVSDGPGNPEAVGDAGIVVPFADADALAAALRALADDRARCERLGGAARQRVVERFTVERMVEETAAVYDAALRSRQGA